MHIPRFFRQEDRQIIVEFLRKNDFGTLVLCDGKRPIASHLLFEILEEGGALFVNGHMSRANSMWRLIETNNEALVIFQGPHTYISPTWYNHINVPTWNYQSVHVYGAPRLVTDREESYGILKRLVDRYETSDLYKMETLPRDFVEKEMRGVAAFQIEVTNIEASYKLSQNRDEESYRSIVAHLEQREDDMSHEIADAMKQQRPQSG